MTGRAGDWRVSLLAKNTTGKHYRGLIGGLATNYNYKPSVLYALYSDLWRRERDSNPRNVAVYTLSRRAPSTTRPSLRRFARHPAGWTRKGKPVAPVVQMNILKKVVKYPFRGGDRQVRFPDGYAAPYLSCRSVAARRLDKGEKLLACQTISDTSPLYRSVTRWRSNGS